MSDQPRGLYFDDFTVGDVHVTGRRTITSTDIVNFACLSGDFNEVHANWEYCQTTAFGEPVAHGPLVYSISAGLVYASGVNDGTLLALLQITDWVMLAPVKHGDTIRLSQEVVATRPASSGDKGVVTFDRRVLNQHDDVVQKMTGTYLYKRRPDNITA
ncbi:MaoC/PaaZ C-terminal domain-containing protein [Rhodococcus opacus]|uniref:MaoC/PaaZ C-terminal domain-containing protein n=1 Tax=Rhodococcus opacus TaxID=37919 RepID=UPI001C460259|nr:MaoC/PaaZ C-terminal domain-containing protein [Rhodococcus opacus]MBV6756693.1 MaoC family dehydratase N-terminal domain-containing protein [Rhodococcus opacus]